MCLAIPVKVVKKEGDLAQVEVGGVSRQASLKLLDGVKVGDYVLLHAGFAIQKIAEEEAQKTLALWEEISEVSG